MSGEGRGPGTEGGLAAPPEYIGKAEELWEWANSHPGMPVERLTLVRLEEPVQGGPDCFEHELGFVLKVRGHADGYLAMFSRLRAMTLAASLLAALGAGSGDEL